MVTRCGVRAAGTSTWCVSKNIAADKAGHIYISGSFSGIAASFDADTLTNIYRNVDFITKYDTVGNVVWATSTNGAVANLKADSVGNIYATGAFTDHQYIAGKDSLANTNPNNTSDIFVSKFDVAGNEVWSGGGRWYTF